MGGNAKKYRQGSKAKQKEREFIVSFKHVTALRPRAQPSWRTKRVEHTSEL